MFRALTSRRLFSTIRDLRAREILDSRGNPTIEVELFTETSMFRSSVPSGASTGVYEAVELRDKDFSRYLGKGVLKAVDNVKSIIKPAILGRNVTDQQNIDKFMVETLDGTSNEWGWIKNKLGANAILGVSLCLARAGAADAGLPLYAYIAHLAGKPIDKFILPVPSLNVINGGSHAGNNLSMQEFMILPTGAPSFREALRIGAEVYHSLKKVIKKKYGLDATNVGDEGGFAPNIQENVEAFILLLEAIESSGHAGKVNLGMDVAASEFFVADQLKYDLDFKNPKNDGRYVIKGFDLADMYLKFAERFPLVSIEDPFHEDDWSNTKLLTDKIGEKVQIVGDDLLTTNPVRVRKAIQEKTCNALLLKLNQIGTLTESIEACTLAQQAGWGVMVSHRSGETDDYFIADLCVGLGTGQIKTGAPCRSERLAKYNELLRIEEELGDRSKYAGDNFRNPQL
ncbi:unnamed protein product [Blepharisma stoltei]|uniref:phosphopyruvate hydratase n=1 Tax=Blepharisma stoltei TaxID=1481888 RepID=A0AAU9J7P8_9CILI|nr:unnamed protein product [Blepharisma stoltei]